MASSVHIIKAQEYRIYLRDQREAHQVQTKISGLQESRINSLLNEVLNKFEDKDSIYQFNTIELDLGCIQKSNYENELVYRLEEELTKYLSYNIMENGRLREGNRIETYERLLENLEYFLVNGHFKWNSAHSYTPLKLWSNLLKTQPEELLQLLKKIGKQETIRKRMIFQFEEDTLEEIVSLAAKEEGRYMISYKNNILNYQEKNRIVETPSQSLHSVVWEIILAYIFAEGRSYYDKKSFLKYLIKKMANKYNIAHNSLLRILTEVIQHNEKSTGPDNEFKKLVSELRNEQISQVPEGTKTTSLEKEGLTAWLDHVMHYLSFGDFNPQFPIRSKKEFNEQFVKILKSHDPLVLFHLNKWLRNDSKKKKILAIATPQTLNQIVDVCDIPTIKVAREFLNNFEGSTLSNNTQNFLDQVQSSKGELILKLPVSENYQEKKLLHGLLRNILNVSNRHEDDLIQFLIETKPLLSKKYQKIVSQFLMTFYQNMGKLVLQGITTEIKNYMDRNSSEFWEAWLDEKIPKWTHDTRLSQATLLKYVEKNFRKNKESEPLQLFIEERKKLMSPSQKTDPERNLSIPERPSPVQKVLSKNRENAILYLLEKGQLPWWIESSSFWSQFDVDFGNMWSSGKNKGMMLKFLKKNAKRASYTRLLDNDNFMMLLEELDTSTKKDSAILANDLHHFITNNLLPLGSITASEHLEFKEAILNIYLDSSENDLDRTLLQFIKKWFRSARIKGQASLSEVFEMVLKETALKISNGALKANLELWIDIISIENHDGKPKSSDREHLVDYLSPFHSNAKDLKSKVALIGFLHTMPGSHPDQFNSLLQDAAFRTSLLSELQKKDLVELIELKISSNQRETYRQALMHLDCYKHYISTKEYQDMHQTFARLLLLKLSIAVIHSWGITEWSNLIFHSLTHVIGRQKNKNIIFRIKEKLSLENGSDRNFNQRFIAQLNELADETSEKVLEDTQRIFNDLVLQSDTRITTNRHTPTEQSEHIQQKIDSKQIKFYQRMLQHLERYRSFISRKEYQVLFRLYSDLVLSALESGEIRVWGLEDWTQLLFHSIHKVIGKKKQTRIFIRIKEKLNVPATGVRPEDMQLLELWEALLLKTSEKPIQDTDTTFRSLLQSSPDTAQTIDGQNEFILQKISSNQREYYQQAVGHLNSYKPYVSSKEYQDMRQLSSKFLLSKLKIDGIRSWGMKDWGHLLFHSMNQVLGKVKNKEIRTKIKEKLNIETEIEINESQQFISRLSTLANEVPENILLETKDTDEDEPYKKLGEETPREFLDPIFVHNAGLIILAPYLGMLFEKCGLLEQSGFIDDTSKFKAVQLLAYAAGGESSHEEAELTINKVLCGLDLTTPLAQVQELETSDKETVDGLLTAVTQQWHPLNGSTIGSLRTSFLQREGRLVEEEGQFYLKVEQKSYDMLLAQIPWNISKIKLSFMNKILEVEWKT